MKNISLLAITILLFGVSVFFRKLSVERIHPFQVQIVAGAVYALEIPLWLYLINRHGIVGYNTWGVVHAALCVITGVGAAVLMGVLLKGSSDPGALATMIAMNPAVTMALSVAFLGEQLTPKKLVATVVMLIGFALFNK
jgi:drug/metabolite transporter (DMT)-like permease